MFFSITGLLAVLLFIWFSLETPPDKTSVSGVHDRKNRSRSEHVAKKRTSEFQNRKTDFFEEEEIGDGSEYGPLPSLLRGTSPDGGYYTDADGRLVPDISVKERFDYFLSAVSEEGLETCIGRIEENIERSLSPDAAEEALGVLSAYINYKKEIHDLHKNLPSLPASGMSDLEGLRSVMDARKTARRKFFNDAYVTAFFGDQERYDDFALQRLEIHYDKGLTESQKESRFAKMEKEMPAPMRERFERQRAFRKKIMSGSP